MSRSRRQPIIKDKTKGEKNGAKYWRAVRRVTKNKTRYLQEELEDSVLPDPKEIVNDYNYSDYRFDLRFGDKETAEKESRK